MGLSAVPRVAPIAWWGMKSSTLTRAPWFGAGCVRRAAGARTTSRNLLAPRRLRLIHLRAIASHRRRYKTPGMAWGR